MGVYHRCWLCCDGVLMGLETWIWAHGPPLLHEHRMICGRCGAVFVAWGPSARRQNVMSGGVRLTRQCGATAR
ncbi:hypothetical protein NDU88_006855 [Pleurodeles waltl]|uniref:Uncharacterized protein n=1 Tax=Pleurodeles waltl TaxID=8319 RepID=A0AAV7QJ35_PLEWA|nr:hypothetical protein NDU88_006855 [Pleurodeles waltl]